MLPLIRILNSLIDKSQDRALAFFLLVSFCWHASLFGIINITFPHTGNSFAGKNITFLGSLLKDYDFEPVRSRVATVKHADTFLNQARVNGFLRFKLVPVKIPQRIEKPANDFIYSGDIIARDKFLNTLSFISGDVRTFSQAMSPAIFDERKLPSLEIFFREGVPSPVRFNLYISENGRVGLLNKEITSGNLDVDLLVSRLLRKSTFDISQFGSKHWRSIELNLKDDNN